VGSDVGETDWWGKAPYWAPTRAQRWIQVDLDERVLGRNRPVELPAPDGVPVAHDGLVVEI